MTIDLTEVRSPEELEGFLGLKAGELLSVLNDIDDVHRYKRFEIPKKNGGVREIYSPCKRLKVVQRAVKDALYGVYKPKPSAHGFVPGRSVVTNARAHLGKTFIFNVDLIDFFGSIHRGRVRGLLMAEPLNLPADVAALLERVCCFKGVLPQGAPTSPILANMIAWKMDAQLQQLAMKSSATYSRYADDLSFSFTCSERRLPAAIVCTSGGLPRPGDALLEVIRSNGFRVNDSKVRLAGRTQRMEATGITVNQWPNVPRRYVRQVGSMLHACEVHGVDKAQAEYSERFESGNRPSGLPKSLTSVLRGKLAYLRSVRGADDPIYNRLASRFNKIQPDNGFKFRIAVPQSAESYDNSLLVVEHCYDDPVQGAMVDTGTAFAVAADLVVTCAHCVAKAKHTIGEVEVYQAAAPTKKFRLALVRIDPHRDIALCRILPVGGAIPSLVPVQITDTPVVSGAQLTIMGFPNHRVGMTTHYSDNVAVSRPYVESAVRKFDVNRQIGKGNSGGPLLDSGHRVAGMALEGVTDSMGVNAVLDWTEIAQFLSQE